MVTSTPVRIPSLDLLKGFVAVGRHLSITVAANELHLTQSAVSRQILALEDALECKLFLRSHRSLSFTPEGERLFRKVDPSLRRLQEAFETLRPAERPVTVTASIGVATLWLLPRIGRFQERYPDIDLRVLALNRVADLKREGIDLGIRYCRPEDAPPGATLLFEESIGVVANPVLGIQRIHSADDFQKLVLLEYEDPQRPWLTWKSWLGEHGWLDARPRSVVRFNQYDQVILAAMSGQGIALGRVPLISDQIEKRLLGYVETPASSRPCRYGYWLIQPETMPRPVVEVATNWIKEEAGSKRVQPPQLGAS
ncbi:MAG: LysR family transcriptional regulator [Proteobacteria bacterium]|nr:LysR family transcriptional regulator [Pseudomonadota bacterium]